MRGKDRRPLLEIYREQREKRWKRLAEQHRKACQENKK